MKLRVLTAAFVVTILVLLQSHSAICQEIRWEKATNPWLKGMVMGLDSADAIYVTGNTIFNNKGWPFQRSTDEGTTWSKGAAFGGSSVTAIVSDRANSLYMGLYNDIGIYHSTDGGMNWTHIQGCGAAIHAIAVGPDGELLVAGWEWVEPNYYGTVYRSTDHGNSWQGDTIQAPGFGWLSGFVFTDDGGILATSVAGGGIFRSTDAGRTWLLSNSGVSTPASVGFDDNRASIVRTRSGDLYASFNAGLYISIDNGENWVRRTDPLPGRTTNCMLAMSTGDLLVGMAHNSGILRSTDRGLTWQQTAADQLATSEQDTNVNVTQLLEMRSGRIIAATDTARMLRIVMPASASVNALQVRTARGPICHISPNPVTSSSTLDIVLPCQSYIRAELIDSYGRRVRTLADGRMSEGEHALAIDAGMLPAGPYFCRIAVDDTTCVRQVTVVR